MNVLREINHNIPANGFFINCKKWNTVKKTFQGPIFDCNNAAGYLSQNINSCCYHSHRNGDMTLNYFYPKPNDTSFFKQL